MSFEGIIAETRDLAVGYSNGKRATAIMSGLSLRARQGELVALIGRNGTGKSTLLRTLAGIQEALAGEIMLEGLSLNEIRTSQLPRIVSFVSTEPVSLRNIRVREVVALGRFPYTNWIGTLTADDEKAVEAAMEAAGVADLAGRSIDSISDGEKQRTLVARSLAQDTGLLIMDEPTAFLDLPSRYSIVNLLRRLTREKGKCVIYSTHDLDTAINEADRIWLMTGEGVTEGAPEDLMLAGSLARAFESPMLSFSTTEGTFRFVRSRETGIALEGRGRIAKMTSRALARCGYTVDPEAAMIVRISENPGGPVWTFVSGSFEKSYRSIYELVANLPETGQ